MGGSSVTDRMELDRSGKTHRKAAAQGGQPELGQGRGSQGRVRVHEPSHTQTGVVRPRP